MVHNEYEELEKNIDKIKNSKKESIYFFKCPECGKLVRIKKDALKHIDGKCQKVGTKRRYEKGLYV